MTLTRVLILDTETTGLDPATCATIEVGVVLYHLQHGIISCYSSVLHAEANPAEAVNRIPAGALLEAPISTTVWSEVGAMAAAADAICAHRAEFDRGFVPPDLRDARPWICTKFDVQWPGVELGAALTTTVLALGLGLSHAHRALTDCLNLARVMDRVREMGHDLPAMLKRGLRPKATFQAMVSYDDRELAKAAGFQWEPQTKRWLRTMAIEDAAALGFKTLQLKNGGK